MANPFVRYSLYPSRIGDIVVRDMTDFTFTSASNKSSVTPGGDLSPRAVVQCCADPMASFSTKDFGALFGSSPAVSLDTGYAASVANGSAATLFQFQVRVDGASFDSAGNSTHSVGSNSKGFLHVSEISAAQDDVSGAKLSCEYFILSTDGSTDPVTWSTASALTSSPAFDGIWYLGPVRIGTHGSSTVLLPGVTSVSIKPGISFRAPRADGMVYPMNGSVYATQPEIRIRTLDFSSLGLKLGSSAISPWANAFANPTTSFLIYFQKGVHGGSRVATSSAVHYMVTATVGDITTDSISVQQVDDATTEIVLRPTRISDNSVAPLLMTANTTIV